LKYKANPNETDKILATPLHLSAIRGNNDILVLLLGNGADVNFRDEFGQSSIFLAIKKKNFNVADTLLLFGADLKYFNYY
jgi:ankyrin repeat protein